MAILDKVHKIIPRIKTAAGYIQYAFRAKDVRMEDNTDLETKITEINNNLIKRVDDVSGIGGEYVETYEILNGKFKIVFGSNVVAPPSSTAGYVLLFSEAQLTKLLGENFSMYCLTPIVWNGAASDNLTHLYNAENWKNNLYVYYYPVNASLLRVNYMLIYRHREK